jgi:hypothetical protein
MLAIRLIASSPGVLGFYIKFQRHSDPQNRFVESAFSDYGDTIITKFTSGQIQAVLGAKSILLEDPRARWETKYRCLVLVNLESIVTLRPL